MADPLSRDHIIMKVAGHYVDRAKYPKKLPVKNNIFRREDIDGDCM